MVEGTWYLAGPMTGIPQFNFPAFEAAAWALRQKGMTIISPHEEDPPEIVRAALRSVDGDPAMLGGPEVWGQRLAHDVQLISNGVAGLVMLNGWQFSRGACLEATVALLAKKRFKAWDGRDLRTLTGPCVAKTVGWKLLRETEGELELVED